MYEVGVVEKRLRTAGVKQQRFPVEVYADAQELYNRKPRPNWRQMADLLAEWHERSPTEGAIRQWAKSGVIEDEPEDAPWVFGSDAFTPEEDGLILRASHVLLFNVAWRRSFDKPAPRWEPSKRGARWLVRIVGSCPQLNVGNYRQMQLIAALVRAAVVGRVDEVATLLATAPWETPDTWDPDDPDFWPPGQDLEMAMQAGMVGEDLVNLAAAAFGFEDTRTETLFTVNPTGDDEDEEADDAEEQASEESQQDRKGEDDDAEQ